MNARVHVRVSVCVSLCFCTQGRGALAATAIGAPRDQQQEEENVVRLENCDHTHDKTEAGKGEEGGRGANRELM